MYCRYCGKELDQNGLCGNCKIVYESQPPQKSVAYVSQKQEKPRTSSFAVWGFVLSVACLFLNGGLSMIVGLTGFIFCFIGMSQTSGGAMRGRGFALLGLLLDLIPFVIGFLNGYLGARGM